MPVALVLFALLGLQPPARPDAASPGPLAWSPDGRWVAYVQEVRPTGKPLSPGWLLRPTITGEPPLPLPDPGGEPSAFRLWATNPETGESTLLEQGPAPVSAPSWSRDGARLAYGRVARGTEGGSAWEVIVQDAPDRRRVLHREPIAGPEPPASRVRTLAPSWSADGRMLALPRLAPSGVLVVRTEGGKPVRSLDGALKPEWSPVENRLAYYATGARPGLSVLDGVLAEPRALAGGPAPFDRLPPPIWSRDGRSVMTLRRSTAMAQPGSPHGNGPGFELVRYRVDGSGVEKPIPLSHDPIGDEADLVGAWFSTDPDLQVAAYATAAVGQTSARMIWCVGRFDAVRKPLNPFDESTLLGAMAVAPSARLVALRAGAGGTWSLPAVCDPEAETLIPFVPDDSARADWLARVVDALWPILRDRVPAPSLADGTAVERPSLLPAPGEFEPGDPAASRLKRLATMGLTLLGPPSPETDELRLLFAYLAGDARTAEPAADRLLARATDPDSRLRLRAIQAQILLLRRDFRRAAPLIEHLRTPRTRQVEDVLEGHRIRSVTDPRSAWPDFLSERAAALKKPPEDANPDLVPPGVLNLDEIRGAPAPAGAVPF